MQALSAAAADPKLRREFDDSIAAKEVLTSEFNSELFLNRRQPILDSNAFLRLNTRATPDAHGRLCANGGMLQLDIVSASVARLLAISGPRRLAEVTSQLREVPREAVHRAVLDLIGRELLTAEHKR